MACPLWVKSNASFLAGASSPEELVAQAAALGHTSMALTDRHGVYGIVRAHRAAQAHNMRLIIGAEVHVHAGMPLVLLAPDKLAYGRLCQLLSLAQLAAEKGKTHLQIEQVVQAIASDAPGNLIALTPHPELLMRLGGHAHPRQLYGLCMRHAHTSDAAREHGLRRAAQRFGLSLVAGTQVLYHVPERRALLDVMRCIAAQTTLAQAGLLLQSNARHALLSAAQMAHLFADEPSWLQQNEDIAQRCQFALDTLRYRYPVQNLPNNQSQGEFLRARVAAGAKKRWGARMPAGMAQQLEHEIDIILSLDYAGYFLSMQDIVLFCQQQGILCQGRGSAANSAVCFCLGITAVDPARMDVLFSRFLSRARAEPPDIDLDIEHRRREEVLQWVYQHYGRTHAAMVANIVRFRWRSAIVEVGKTLQLPLPALQALSGRVGYAGEAHAGGFSESIDWPQVLRHAQLSPVQNEVAHLLRLAQALRGAPRYLSQHPGGFVLGNEPIQTLCAVEPARMPGRTVLQWDKQDIDDMGLFKVDLLGLGALHHIHCAFDEIRATDGQALSLATVPQEDAQTYAMLQKAQSVGVFQVESRAQMSMLPRLRPATFYDLVVQVAIVRPGPIQGDMVHPYLLQRERGTPIVYPHPHFSSILDKTFGVPIFQEQVMRLAIDAAAYTPDEADQLRRDMAAWRSADRLQAHHLRIVTGMQKHGIEAEFAERLFAQIRGFGEYGFPESHAASFAHLVYVTAYLRRHYFAAFVCALLNAAPMGFYAPSTVVADARHYGLRMLPIDVQHSRWDCHVCPSEDVGVHRFAVRMGVRYVRGIGVREQQLLAQAPPPYANLADFVRRTQLPAPALDALARAGALDSLWPAGSYAPGYGAPRRAIRWQLKSLFAGRTDALLVPGSAAAALPAALLRPMHIDERIAWDWAASDHSTLGHLLQALRPHLAARGWQTTAQLHDGIDGAQASCFARIICWQRPETAKGMLFLTLEDECGWLNVLVRPPVQARYVNALAPSQGRIGIRGTLQIRHGSTHLVAQSIVVHP